jgi:hypothetical protein
MSYSDFSSWPRDQEQSFVVYEQHAMESGKKAFTVGAISGLIFLVLAVGIYAGVKPDERDITKDMNMSNLTKRSKVDAPAPAPAPKAEAPAPTPAPAAAPAAAPSGEAPAAPAEEKKE